MALARADENVPWEERFEVDKSEGMGGCIKDLCPLLVTIYHHD